MKLKLIFCLLGPIVTSSCIKDYLGNPKNCHNCPEVGLSIEMYTADLEGIVGSRTVVFDGAIWTIIPVLSGTTSHYEVWSSTDGFDWANRESNLPTTSSTDAIVRGQFAVYERLAVYEKKIWLFTEFDGVLNTADGMTWNRVSSSPIEGSFLSNIAVFDNKMFAYIDKGTPLTKNIYSITDGITWNLETEDIFGERLHRWGGNLFAYEAYLYFIGGFVPEIFQTTNEIWRSANGIDWELVPQSPDTERENSEVIETVFFHQVTSYDNKVFITGGLRSELGDTGTNVMYYSEDMTTWYRYDGSGNEILLSMSEHAAVVFEEQLLLIGGNSYNICDDPLFDPPSKHSVWTIEKLPQFQKT